MLNAWFHGSLKFHSGVRASAGLSGGLLLIALLLMKPRYPKQRNFTKGMFASFWIFVKDIPYVFTVVGYVTYDLRSFFSYHMFHRAALALAGLYSSFSSTLLRMESTQVLPSILYVHFFACPSPCELQYSQIAILNGASVIGRVIPNMLASKIGLFNVIVPSLYIVSILVFCTLVINNAAGTLIFALLSLVWVLFRYM